jgi:hypothetical protein
MDVNGDGQLDATRWAGAQDGVLVWDKYHDGQVHDHTQFAFAQYDTTSAVWHNHTAQALIDQQVMTAAYVL